MSKEFLKIDRSKDNLKGRFRVLQFMEGDTYVVYLPSLGISGYGDTPDEALKLIKESLNDFSENLMNLNSEAEIFRTLREFGWTRDRIFRKKMSNLSTTTFEDIKKQFNIPDSTDIKELSLAV